MAVVYGLLHYGDEKWIKINYMRNVFEFYQNTNRIPFKNHEHFKKVFDEIQAEKEKYKQISHNDFEHKEDFEKIKHYVFNTLRGLDIEFPDFAEHSSLSIKHY